MMKIYNGENMLLGRLAAVVAKDALLGEEVRVVNCEKVVISGAKANTVAYEKHRRTRKGYPLKSANVSRLPERIVRRSVRGMLPWKIARGKEAYKRVMCYRDVPAELQNQAMIIVEKASAKKLPNLKFITVGDVSRQMGLTTGTP
ncbi:MAG TPA: 50S ribosomal protein L13 [Candidatus Nanoarchaeia archaeon]|nr:50S ribosomal protein L13 [Candidatus Nanoarchaeia archaeon]